MIQIHGNTILSIRFNLIIKTHDSNPWQIIYQKAWFSLAISKNPIFIGNIENPIFIGNIKNPILAGNIKKPSFHWQY